MPKNGRLAHPLFMGHAPGSPVIAIVPVSVCINSAVSWDGHVSKLFMTSLCRHLIGSSCQFLSLPAGFVLPVARNIIYAQLEISDCKETLTLTLTLGQKKLTCHHVSIIGQRPSPTFCSITICWYSFKAESSFREILLNG